MRNSNDGGSGGGRRENKQGGAQRYEQDRGRGGRTSVSTAHMERAQRNGSTSEATRALHQAAGGERREGERGVSDTHGGAVRFGELEVERVAREVPLHSKEGKSVISRGVEMRAEWERRRTMSMPPILLSTASLPLAASDSGSSYVMTTLRDLLYRNGCNAGESESASTRFAKVRAERQRASTHRGRARVPLARVAVGADVIDLGRARVLDDDAVVDQVDKLDLVALEARQVTRADLARTVTRLEDAVASASRAATSRVAARERVPVNLGDVLARDAGAGLARVVVGAHDDVALGEDVACGLALGALGRAACARRASALAWPSRYQRCPSDM